VNTIMPFSVLLLIWLVLTVAAAIAGAISHQLPAHWPRGNHGITFPVTLGVGSVVMSRIFSPSPACYHTF
jgi:hypothetical protein